MRKSFWQGVVTAFGMVGVGAATWLFWRHNTRPLAQDDAAFGPAFGSTTDKVVAGYSLWLEVRFPAHFLALKTRLKSEREAAEAEAIVFSMLRWMNLCPAPNEDIATGGVDFRCEPKGKDRFFVEVTSIPRETVTQRSGLPHSGEHIGGFSMLTSVLKAKATRKAAQMGKLDGARVLAVVTNHRNADMLVGSRAAAQLLTGDTVISVPIGEAQGQPTGEVAPLKNSVFFKLDRTGGILACRKSISALLRIAASGNHSRAVGVLHPEPGC